MRRRYAMPSRRPSPWLSPEIGNGRDLRARRDRDAVGGREANQIRRRPHRQLAVHVRAVRLDGLHADAQPARHVLARRAGHDQAKHLDLARRQPLQAHRAARHRRVRGRRAQRQATLQRRRDVLCAPPPPCESPPAAPRSAATSARSRSRPPPAPPPRRTRREKPVMTMTRPFSRPRRNARTSSTALPSPSDRSASTMSGRALSSSGNASRMLDATPTTSQSCTSPSRLASASRTISWSSTTSTRIMARLVFSPAHQVSTNVDPSRAKRSGPRKILFAVDSGTICACD